MEYNRQVTGLIRKNQIFEAKTAKGGKNLIIIMNISPDGWVIYAHGDRAKKNRYDDFYRCVENGDFEHKERHQIDVERLTMATVGLDAIAKGVNVDQVLNERSDIDNGQRSINLNKLLIGM